MNPEVIKGSIQAVIDGLTPLASKLGIAVEAIFGWAIKHNYALGLTMLLPLPVFITLVIISYKNGKKADFDDFDKGNLEAVVCIVSAILAFVFMMLTIGYLPKAIDRLVAPEWNASKDIYELIKQ